MFIMLFAASLFPFRPGAMICKPQIESHYYSTFSCRRNDVVTGVRFNGRELTIICGRLKIVCEKNIIIYRDDEV